MGNFIAEMQILIRENKQFEADCERQLLVIGEVATQRDKLHTENADLKQFIEALQGDIELLKAKLEWIPVSERLPEKPDFWGKEINAIIKGKPKIIEYYGLRIGMTHWRPITLPNDGISE